MRETFIAVKRTIVIGIGLMVASHLPVFTRMVFATDARNLDESMDRQESKAAFDITVLSLSSAVVTGLEDIGPGGWDAEAAIRGTIVVDKVTNCGRQVVESVERWAGNQRYVISKKSVTPGGVRIHAVAQGGHYEVLYRLHKDGAIARISFWFIDKNGNETTPGELDTKTLRSSLLSAIQCLVPS